MFIISSSTFTRFVWGYNNLHKLGYWDENGDWNWGFISRYRTYPNRKQQHNYFVEEVRRISLRRLKKYDLILPPFLMHWILIDKEDTILIWSSHEFVRSTSHRMIKGNKRICQITEPFSELREYQAERQSPKSSRSKCSIYGKIICTVTMKIPTSSRGKTFPVILPSEVCTPAKIASRSTRDAIDEGEVTAYIRDGCAWGQWELYSGFIILAMNTWK